MAAAEESPEGAPHFQRGWKQWTRPLQTVEGELDPQKMAQDSSVMYHANILTEWSKLGFH